MVMKIVFVCLMVGVVAEEVWWHYRRKQTVERMRAVMEQLMLDLAADDNETV